MKKVTITYGLISGAISAVLMICTALVAHKISYDKSMFIGYAGMVLSFLFIYFGMVSYRDNYNGGTISFGKALKPGFLIMLISCLCYTVAWLIVHHTMMPDFMDKYVAHQIEAMRKKGASEAAIAKASADMAYYSELYKNPLIEAGMTILEPLPVGLVVTLVSALIVSRKKQKSTVVQ